MYHNSFIWSCSVPFCNMFYAYHLVGILLHANSFFTLFFAMLITLFVLLLQNQSRLIWAFQRYISLVVYRCLLAPAPFVEKAAFLPLDYIFVKNQLGISVWVHFSVLYFVYISAQLCLWSCSSLVDWWGPMTPIHFKAAFPRVCPSDGDLHFVF